MKHLLTTSTLMLCLTLSVQAQTPETGPKTLFSSAETGDLNTLQSLLKQGNTIDQRNSSGYTPLLIAAQKGHSKLVKALLAAGADPNVRGDNGESFFLMRIAGGDLPAVKQMLKDGADLYDSDHDNDGALTYAVDSGNTELVDYFLQLGLAPDFVNSRGSSLLDFAARYKNLEMFKHLLKKGLNPHANDGSVLFSAALYGQWEMLQILLDQYGFKVNAKTRSGTSLFTHAAGSGQLELLKKLEARGADPLSKNEFNWNALHEASNAGDLASVKYLMQKGLDPNSKSQAGYTPLDYASIKGDLELCQYMLDHGGKLEKTYIERAWQTGNFEALEFWEKQGLTLSPEENQKQFSDLLNYSEVSEADALKFLRHSNLPPQSQAKDLLLPFAVKRNYVRLVETLLAQGAQPEAAYQQPYSEFDGSTSFDFAVTQPNLDLSQRFFKAEYIQRKNRTGYTPLMLAIKANQLEQAKFLISKGADPRVIFEGSNFRGQGLMHFAATQSLEAVQWLHETHKLPLNTPDDEGLTPLMLAVKEGQDKIVKYLIAKGVPVDQRVEESETYHYAQGYTLLHFATENRNFELFQWLVEKQDLDIHSQNQAQETPLTMALSKDQARLVRYLIQKGANINSLNSENQSLLHLAAQQGDLTQVKSLIKAGLSPLAKDKVGHLPLHFAALYGHTEVLAYFLSLKDIHPDLALLSETEYFNYKNGRTALHEAASAGKLECIQLLLKHGAKVDLRDRENETPLMLAANAGHFEIVKLLLAAGANLQAKNHNGDSVLSKALSTEANPDFIFYLLEQGADVKTVNHQGRNLLYPAASQPSSQILAALLKKGLDIHKRDDSGNTLLHADLSLDVFRFLHEQGLSLQALNENQQTPLFFQKNMDVVEYAVKHGAKLNLVDENGDGLLHSYRYADKQIFAYFIAQGIDVNLQNETGQTPLHSSLFVGLEQSQILLKAKANPNLQDKRGNSILHLAVENMDQGLVEVLLEYKADPRLKNKDHQTPLAVAAVKGNMLALQTLLAAAKYSKDEIQLALKWATIKEHERIVKHLETVLKQKT